LLDGLFEHPAKEGRLAGFASIAEQARQAKVEVLGTPNPNLQPSDFSLLISLVSLVSGIGNEGR
jgi:hypothetical protein